MFAVGVGGVSVVSTVGSTMFVSGRTSCASTFGVNVVSIITARINDKEILEVVKCEFTLNIFWKKKIMNIMTVVFNPTHIFNNSKLALNLKIF